MAPLNPLGQPFGAPSQIFNIPAPIGTENVNRGIGDVASAIAAVFAASQQKKGGTQQFQQSLGALLGGGGGAVAPSIPQMSTLGGGPQQAAQNPNAALFSQLGQITDPATRQRVLQSLTTQQLISPEQREQASATLDLTRAQAGKARQPLQVTQTQLIGRIGEKIANGTATPAEENVFNRLTEKAGTVVNVNNIESLTPNVRTQIEALKDAQSMLNDFVSDPENENVLKNSDVNVITNTKGQLQLEVKPKGAPTATQLKEISDLVGLKNSMGTIDALFDPSFVGVIEGAGSVRGVSEATGVDVVKSIKQGRKVELTGKQVQFNRIVNDLSDRLLRARSGAQINEQEFKRLTKIVPTLGLSEVAFKARQKDFERELNNIIATKEATIQQAGQRPIRLLQQPQGPTRAEAGKIASPKTQAEFDAIPQGTIFIDEDGLRKRKL